MAQTWRVDKKGAGQKLVRFLKLALGESWSARKIKEAVDKSLCRVNGKVELFASYVVHEGDRVAFYGHLVQKSSRPTCFDPKRLMYEDEALICYNKPAGVNCDREGLEAWLRKRFPSARLVHRLDRETTGIVVFSKTPEAHKILLNLFKQREVKKQYLALVDGSLKEEKGVCHQRIGELSRRGNQVVRGVTPHGERAETEWMCEARSKEASFVRCFPVTGRTHQIRIHLSAMGHPIIGDGKYSRRFRCHYATQRYLLHAHKIAFPHPLEDREVEVTCPLPSDFQEALAALGLE